MTATTQPAGPAAIPPEPSSAAAAIGVGGAVLLVGTRITLRLGVQLLVAGLLVLGGATGTGQPLDAAAGVVEWAAEHACYPLLTSGDGLDLGLAPYRVGSVLPFLATWPVATTPWAGGCYRSWRPSGSSTAARCWLLAWWDAPGPAVRSM